MSEMPTLGEVTMGDAELEQQGFQVTDVSSAQWAAERVIDKMEQAAQIEAHAKMLKQQVDQWAESEIAQIEDDQSYLRVLLEQWAEQEVGDRKKHVDLPTARLGFRKRPDRVEIQDEQAAIDELQEEHPECIKVKKSVDKTKLKKLLERGVSIESAFIAEGGKSFYVDGR